MADLSYEQLQARAINNMDDAGAALTDDDQRAFLIARAQVHAMLSVGSALKDLAKAIRESK